MMTVLKKMKVRIRLDEVSRRLHMKSDRDLDPIRHLIDIAEKIIEPKAIYRVCYIDEKAQNTVSIGGLRLSSRVLRKNLEEVERVFPYVVTIGSQLAEKQGASADLLENFYLDAIGNVALNSARSQLKNHLQNKFALNKISSMAPGSLSDWPIEEQAPLFQMIGDVQNSIGVKLTKSLLMLPAKSVSGIFFAKEISFVSCQLCPRKRCESRKAAYDEAVAAEYGISHQN
jgi:hypothetical protein